MKGGQSMTEAQRTAYKSYWASLKGKPSNFTGRSHSHESRVKMSVVEKRQYKTGERVHPRGMLGKRISNETKAKMSIAHKGKPATREIKYGAAHHSWIADRTKLKTARKEAYDVRYKTWMKSVKNRDGWKCRISNDGCSGRLEAHHILGWEEYPDLRYQSNNGITLCLAHHPRKRAEEKRLSPYFQSLVSVSKAII